MRANLIGLLAMLVAGGAMATESGAAVVETVVKSTYSWDGAALPAYPAGQPEVTLLRITIPPGVELALHRHPVINVGLMVSGELTVISEQGETLRLRAGDPIVELVDKWHYGRNDGQETVEIVAFYAGIDGRPVTVAKPGERHGH